MEIQRVRWWRSWEKLSGLVKRRIMSGEFRSWRVFSKLQRITRERSSMFFAPISLNLNLSPSFTRSVFFMKIPCFFIIFIYARLQESYSIFMWCGYVNCAISVFNELWVDWTGFELNGWIVWVISRNDALIIEKDWHWLFIGLY